MEFDLLSNRVIGCAIEVHKALGPGLLESAYEQCLSHELTITAIAHKTQVPMPIYYKGITLDCGYRVDLVIEDSLIIELKSVDKILVLPGFPCEKTGAAEANPKPHSKYDTRPAAAVTDR